MLYCISSSVNSCAQTKRKTLRAETLAFHTYIHTFPALLFMQYALISISFSLFLAQTYISFSFFFLIHFSLVKAHTQPNQSHTHTHTQASAALQACPVSAPSIWCVCNQLSTHSLEGNKLTK